MILNVYAFYDDDAEEYLAPMVCRNDKLMVKSIKQSVLADSSRVDLDGKHLFLIGIYDTELGIITDKIKSEIPLPDFFADLTGDKDDSDAN